MRSFVLCALLAVVMCLPADAARPRRGKKAPRAAAPVEEITETLEGSVPSFVDKVPIHYRAEGAGSPAIVFIHCWSGNSGYWKNEAPEFAKDHRVVTLDLAGHGQSGRARRNYTIQAFAGDVKTVVEKLGLRKVVLVGHSMGGDVMVEAARIMPERVVGLVAVDTLHDADDHGTPEERKAFLKPFHDDFKGATEQLVHKLFRPDADPAVVEKVTKDFTSASPEIAISSMENLVAYDLADGLKRVKAPIVAINSDLFPTKVDVNRKYAKSFDLVVMEGVGHFPQLERPDEFNKKLADAIASFK